MKKLWILFTALALLVVASPMFAVDHSLTGDFQWFGNYDNEFTGAMTKARIETTSKLDDFNTIATELRYSASGLDWKAADVQVKMFQLTTDITGALGLSLPVTVKSKVGVWEYATTQWWNQDRAGYTWVNGYFDADTSASGAGELDIGVGPVTVVLLQDFGFAAAATQFGVNGAFGPVAFAVEYGAETGYFGEGAFGIEAKYATEIAGIALAVVPSFNYDLPVSGGTAGWKFDAELSAAYSMFKVAAGINFDDKSKMMLVAEAKVAPVKNAEIWAAMYMDTHATNALQGVDLMASYMFGAAKFIAGYVIGGTDKTPIPVHSGDVKFANGLYVGVSVSPF